ncbi:MAG: di-trans,poly-cis-decaprenylcistransferase [Rickettsiaceae bacterium]|nr:di-trans,poly-cis-decaprenylcistransferase [Rickettsiaceae bacterium]
MPDININSNEINHLAIIMDGNSRWADSQGLHKFAGYAKGVDVMSEIIRNISSHNVKYITFYAFSQENWNRPKEDIKFLLELLSQKLDSEEDDFIKNNIRLKFIGRLDKISLELLNKINKIEELTKFNTKLTVTIAFSYSGREEIVDACQKLIDNNVKNVTVELIAKQMYFPQMPDVDLLIRTGKEKRLSNFLTWHSTYAELYFCEKYWPEFSLEDLNKALNDFSTRQRNFGNARKL